MTPQLFACPRRRCYRVVPRLTEIRILEGLTENAPIYVCDGCLLEIERDFGGPAYIVERTGRTLGA